MATEYYIVKPEKRTLFYLGKHFSYLNGLADYKYKRHADWMEYDDYKEIMCDLILDNPCYFDYDTVTLRHLQELAIAIYDFCLDSPVYIDNDCSENFNNWLEFDDTNGICEIFEQVNNELGIE